MYHFSKAKIYCCCITIITVIIALVARARGSFSIIIIISIVFQFDACCITNQQQWQSNNTTNNNNQLQTNKRNNNNNNNNQVLVIGVCVHGTHRLKSAHKSITRRLFYGCIGNMHSLVGKFRNGKKNPHADEIENPFWINKSLKCHSCCDFIMGFLWLHVMFAHWFLYRCDHYECDRLVTIESARMKSWIVILCVCVEECWMCGAMREWDVIVVF